MLNDMDDADNINRDANDIDVYNAHIIHANMVAS